MKDWEVKKVNELYKQLDQLKQQNAILEKQLLQLQKHCDTEGYWGRCDDSCGCGDIKSDLDEIKRLLTPAKTKRVTRKTSKRS